MESTTANCRRRIEARRPPGRNDGCQQAHAGRESGGAQPQPKKLLEKAGIKPEPGELIFCDRMRDAVAHARKHMGEDIPPDAPLSTPISSWLHTR